VSESGFEYILAVSAFDDSSSEGKILNISAGHDFEQIFHGNQIQPDIRTHGVTPWDVTDVGWVNVGDTRPRIEPALITSISEWPSGQPSGWNTIEQSARSVHLLQLIDRFSRASQHLEPVAMSVIHAVQSFVRRLLRQERRIVGTVSEDGILTLEIRLDSDVQLFVEIDRHGAVEATIFEPGTGITGLEAVTVSDLVRSEHLVSDPH